MSKLNTDEDEPMTRSDLLALVVLLLNGALALWLAVAAVIGLFTSG